MLKLASRLQLANCSLYELPFFSACLLHSRRGVSTFSRPTQANLNGAPLLAQMRGQQNAHNPIATRRSHYDDFCLLAAAATPATAATAHIFGPAM